MSELADNLAGIRWRISAACLRAGRAPDSVELLAVSKTFPVEAVREMAAAGQTLFGENRVQEALAKIPQAPPHLRWHMIGHLQSNKVRKILPLVEAVQSIDSADLAAVVQRIAGELDLRPRVWLEVNLAGEESKHGFTPEQLRAALPEIATHDRLRIEGLMAVPPAVEDPEEARPWFAMLRNLRDELAAVTGVALPGLSMGMSHDFEVAIEEGSTLVRVGSALFGGRA
jgi:pyridoxal phosphate enzyme (YggS family)